MKKNLAKRRVLGLLTGAVLMSSSVAWADGYNIDLDSNLNFASTSMPDDSLSIGGSVFKPENDTGCERSIAIGIESQVGSQDVSNQKANDSVAVGYKAYVTSAGSIALGSEAQVDGINGMALGYQAEVRDGYQNSVALGKGSVASDNNVVSVGDGGAVDSNNKSYGPDYRKIVNVEDGEIDTGSHEAVTGGQLYDNYGGGAATLKTNGSSLIEGKGYDLTTALIKLSEEVEDNIYTKEQVNNLLSNGGNYVEKETIAGGTQTNISENFVVTNTTVSGGSGTTTSVTINSTDDDCIVMNNEGITVGKNSTHMDGTGFYAGRKDISGDHVYDNVRAAMTEGGKLKAADGKFEVTESGNVTAQEVTATKLQISDGNGGTIDVETELSKKADQSALDAEVANRQGDVSALEQKIADLGGGNSAAIAGINQRLEKTNAKINKVGAGAAALAALHPLDYDPDDKLTFSAGMGNYAGENAAALGAFYRPNEKFMLSLGGTMGNGENMVNLGLSIGLDKPSGFAKMSKRELIQEVNAVKAENEAMKDQLANADERIAKLEALVAQLVAK